MPYQPRLARNQFRSESRSAPCISSVTTSIMITTSNSSLKRNVLPNQLLDVLLHTIAMSGLARVRTELSYMLVIPSLAPFWNAARCNLGRFPQQEAQDRTPLLRDMAQSSPISAGVLQGY